MNTLSSWPSEQCRWASLVCTAHVPGPLVCGLQLLHAFLFTMVISYHCWLYALCCAVCRTCHPCMPVRCWAAAALQEPSWVGRYQSWEPFECCKQLFQRSLAQCRRRCQPAKCLMPFFTQAMPAASASIGAECPRKHWARSAWCPMYMRRRMVCVLSVQFL
jgi:hypothetical protein